MTLYPDYKPSGIDWIGDIPSHWEVKKLKYVVSKVGSGVTPSGGASVYKEEGIPLLRSQNIHFDGLRLDDVAYIDIDVDESMKNSRIEQGDVLLNITGASIGRCYYIDKNLERGNVNQHVCIIRPRLSDVSTRLLYLLLRSSLGQTQIDLLQTGANREGLNFEQLRNFNLIIPPISEQTIIARYLDEKTAQLDTLIARKRRLIDLLREEKAALINEAVTKGINPNVPMKDSGIEWIGGVPAHWEVKKLKWVARTNSGGTPTSSRQEEYYNGNIPWIRTLDLNDSVVTSTEYLITEKAVADSSCRINPINTVMIAMYGGEGTIGKSGLAKIEAATNQAICCILPNNQFNPHFLHAVLKFYRPFWMIGAEGTRRDPNISQEDVKNVSLAFPPFNEQTQIITYLDIETTKIDYTLSRIEREIELMQEYRTALISEVVTGKVCIV